MTQTALALTFMGWGGMGLVVLFRLALWVRHKTLMDNMYWFMVAGGVLCLPVLVRFVFLMGEIGMLE
jgi:hypothetical protein